jgi:hypothetical protein
MMTRPLDNGGPCRRMVGVMLPQQRRNQIMAKKQKVNKTQAVREYLKAHHGATSSEIAVALGKQGVKISPNYVAGIKAKVKAKRAARKSRTTATPAPASAPVVAAPEVPAKPSTGITLEQIKAVSQTVKVIGGFARLHEMLAVIKEVGGVKKFKDLLEAMAVAETDQIPY